MHRRRPGSVYSLRVARKHAHCFLLFLHQHIARIVSGQQSMCNDAPWRWALFATPEGVLFLEECLARYADIIGALPDTCRGKASSTAPARRLHLPFLGVDA